MPRFISLVAVLLLLVTAVPAMACVTGQQMTQTESACCQTMHGNCAAMAKSGCCRVEVRDQYPQATAQAPAATIHLVAFAMVYFDLAMPQMGLPARWLAPDDHSPPISRSTKPTVLRI